MCTLLLPLSHTGLLLCLLLLFGALELLRIGVDELVFGGAGDDLHMDVALAGKEEALADREL